VVGRLDLARLRASGLVEVGGVRNLVLRRRDRPALEAVGDLLGDNERQPRVLGG
jgi:hypothetical protein